MLMVAPCFWILECTHTQPHCLDSCDVTSVTPASLSPPLPPALGPAFKSRPPSPHRPIRAPKITQHLCCNLHRTLSLQRRKQRLEVDKGLAGELWGCDLNPELVFPNPPCYFMTSEEASLHTQLRCLLILGFLLPPCLLCISCGQTQESGPLPKGERPNSCILVQKQSCT